MRGAENSHLSCAVPSTYNSARKREVIQGINQHSLTRSQLRNAINEHIFHALDRRILCRKLLDGATFEQIAEEVDRSTNCVKERYRRALAVLSEFIQ